MQAVTVDLSKFCSEKVTTQQPRASVDSVLGELIADKLEAFSTTSNVLEPERGDLNSLVATLDMAFSKHIPVVLTPDDFLLPLLHATAIAQNLQAKGLPPKEKLDLVVRRDDFMLGKPDNPWHEIFAEFRVRITEYIGKGKADLYSGNFSTTGELQQAAYDVALMDAYQSQFSYHNMFLCGIPSVTLKGTHSDWETFRSKSEKIISSLEGFDNDWRYEITETISKICDTACEKKFDGSDTFWSSIYRWKMHSGGAGIDGWITLFFPILRVASDLRIGKLDDIKGVSSWTCTRSVTSFPGSLASVPVKCNNHGTLVDLRYYAGQVGVAQDSEGNIFPAWGWIISRAD